MSERVKIIFDLENDNTYNKRENDVGDDNRETRQFMTKYEFTEIIGARAAMLSQGADPLVFTTETDHGKIALQELMEGHLPIIVKRFLPGKTYEEFKISELDMSNIEY